MNFTAILAGLKQQHRRTQEKERNELLAKLHLNKFPTSPVELEAYIERQEALEIEREKEKQLHLPLVIDLHPSIHKKSILHVLINQPEHYPAQQFLIHSRKTAVFTENNSKNEIFSDPNMTLHFCSYERLTMRGLAYLHQERRSSTSTASADSEDSISLGTKRYVIHYHPDNSVDLLPYSRYHLDEASRLVNSKHAEKLKPSELEQLCRNLFETVDQELDTQRRIIAPITARSSFSALMKRQGDSPIFNQRSSTFQTDTTDKSVVAALDRFFGK